MFRSKVPPKKPSGGGKTLEELQKIRAELSSLCKESVIVFAEACRKCKVDWVPELNKYKADPKKPFLYGGISFLTEEGDLRGDQVYLIDLKELSSKTHARLCFGYGKERTHPFVRVDWRPTTASTYEFLTPDGDDDVAFTKSYPAILFAQARCKCAIRSAWRSGDLHLPKNIKQVQMIWTSTSEDGDCTKDYAAIKQAKYFPSFEEDVRKRILSEAEVLSRTGAKVAAKNEIAAKVIEQKKASTAAKEDAEKSFLEIFTDVEDNDEDEAKNSQKDKPSKRDEKKEDQSQKKAQDKPPSPQLQGSQIPSKSQKEKEDKRKSPERNEHGEEINPGTEPFETAEELEAKDKRARQVAEKNARADLNRRIKIEKKDESDYEPEESSSNSEGEEYKPDKKKKKMASKGSRTRGGKKAKKVKKDKEGKKAENKKKETRRMSTRAQSTPKKPSEENKVTFTDPNESDDDFVPLTPKSGPPKVVRVTNSGLTVVLRPSALDGVKAKPPPPPPSNSVTVEALVHKAPTHGGDDDIIVDTTYEPGDGAVAFGIGPVGDDSLIGDTPGGDAINDFLSQGFGPEGTRAFLQLPQRETKEKNATKEDDDLWTPRTTRSKSTEETTPLASQEATPGPSSVESSGRPLRKTKSSSKYAQFVGSGPPVQGELVNLVRASRADVRKGFRNLVDSMEVIQREQMIAEANGERAVEAMEYFMALAGKNLHPGEMETFESKKNHLLDALKQTTFFNVDLFDRSVAAEAREAVFRGIVVECLERLKVINAMSSSFGSELNRKYENLLENDDYGAVVEDLVKAHFYNCDGSVSAAVLDSVTGALSRARTTPKPKKVVFRNTIPWPPGYEHMANGWTGVWLEDDLPLKNELLDLPLEDFVPFETIKSLSNGSKYLYCGENVWMSTELIKEWHDEWLKTPKDGEKKFLEVHCKKFLELVMSELFMHGCTGLEITNYYRDNANPYTAKKVRALEGILDMFAEHYKAECVRRGMSKKDYEDTSKTTGRLLTALAQYGSNNRLSSLSRGKYNILQCPGMFFHPGNFIRFIDQSMNLKDNFYKNFYTPYASMSAGMKESLKTVVSRGKKQEWGVHNFAAKRRVDQEDEECMQETLKMTDNNVKEFRSDLGVLVRSLGKDKAATQMFQSIDPGKWMSIIQKNLSKERKDMRKKATRRVRRSAALRSSQGEGSGTSAEGGPSATGDGGGPSNSRKRKKEAQETEADLTSDENSDSSSTSGDSGSENSDAEEEPPKKRGRKSKYSS